MLWEFCWEKHAIENVCKFSFWKYFKAICMEIIMGQFLHFNLILWLFHKTYGGMHVWKCGLFTELRVLSFMKKVGKLWAIFEREV